MTTTKLETTLPKRLRLVRFVASNIKRVKLIAFSPSKSVVQLTGENGAGKSSALDCFEYALRGKGTHPTEPIRRGEDGGYTLLDFGDMIVRREFTRDARNEEERDAGVPPYPGTYLSVTTAKGAKFPSQQHMLDRMWAELAHEPERWAELMSPKEQLRFLRDVVPLEINLEEIEAQIDADFETRTGVNREAKQLEARVEAFLVDPDWPDTPVDMSATLTAISRANDHNLHVRQLTQKLENDRREVTRRLNEARDKRVQAARLVAEAEQLETDAQHLHTNIEETDVPALIDTAPLQQKMMDAEAINDQVRQRREYTKLHTEWKAKQAEGEALTLKIERARATIDKAIANAKFPVEGLSFGRGEVMYQGLPFNQAPLSRRMVIACAVVLAKDPQLRIILIRHGGLLDQHTWAAVEKWADDNDVLVIGETVDLSGKIGVYIEDGAIAAIEPGVAKQVTTT